MNNEKPLVIVLSRNYSTGLGVIRSLGQAGFDVELIASTKKRGSSIIASSSKYVSHTIEVVSPKIQEDKGNEIVGHLLALAIRGGKPVLFPTDDFTMMIVDKYQDILKKYYYIPTVNDPEQTITNLMDKRVQTAYAKKCGMRTPKEWIISLREEKLAILEDIEFPCFVKPLQSVSGRKVEMRRVDDRKALEMHLKKMQQYFKDRDVLIQEFLTIDKEYDLSGVCFGNKIFIPSVIEKTHISNHEKGVTMCGKMVSCEVLGDMMENIRKFLKLLGYNGMFDMEFTKCGDNIYFNEINLRSGGPNYFYCLNGVNLPAILVDEILGTEHDPERETVREYGKSFVYEKVAWEDYIYSFMTKDELEQCINDADYTLLVNDEDPKPGKHFKRRIRLSAIKQKLKMMVGRANG